MRCRSTDPCYMGKDRGVSQRGFYGHLEPGSYIQAWLLGLRVSSTSFSGLSTRTSSSESLPLLETTRLENSDIPGARNPIQICSMAGTRIVAKRTLCFPRGQYLPAKLREVSGLTIPLASLLLHILGAAFMWYRSAYNESINLGFSTRC